MQFKRIICDLGASSAIKRYNMCIEDTMRGLSVQCANWGYNVSIGGMMCQLGVQCVSCGYTM